MIKHWKHKGLKLFWDAGTTKGIQRGHASRLRDQLAALDAATGPNDMDFVGWGCHPQGGNKKGKPKTYAVTVNGNWRLTFEFRDGEAYVVNYKDYH
jgi:proteic killer suppression protein